MKRNTGAKEKILNFLLDDPEGNFYLTQIAQGTAVADSTTQHVLENQISDDFLTKEKVGNLSYYRLNTDNPLVKQAKITRTLQEIAPLVECLWEFSQKIILFGSCAIGEDTRQSDIDLFVLTGEKDEVRGVISRFKSRRKIQAIIKNYLEFSETREKDNYFYEEINKGRVLWEAKHD